ncbi:type II DNA topoisomerase [Massarina eburnea CBS 473.64]|uniref:DNA topoisomerase 2 n=1 Tax=Massarina eburnea CBS 473.64 TaxID=1395130 RepID=A0A6A6S5W1_9PLEO|nr:type II DNA topoisomerase [Massarina eburnea CBS 473.64]
MSDDDSLMAFDEGASSDFAAPVKPAKATKAKAAPKKAAGPAKPRGRPAKDPSAPPKPRAKAAPKKKAAAAADDDNSDIDMAPAPKPRAKAAPKKKPVAVSDDENSDVDMADPVNGDDDSLLADTPPQKAKAPAAKKKAANPLADVTNDSFDMADGMVEVPAGKKAAGGAANKYQMLTHLEHIMKRPDTYIGSVERTEDNMWVYNSEQEQMEYRKVSYVPGLYKIFDEILVNAADNKQNDKNMSEIRVTVDRETGEISVKNDGKGIPIEIHKEHGIYVPEMIFGHLLTSSNYDDNQAKVTGGRNGYGAKLCNVFSTEFTLETVDSKQKKKYKQTWTENMSKMGKAKITDIKGAEDYTKVTYKADYVKFGMTGIDDDFEALAKRRTYDMAGTLRGIKVFLNGTRVKVNSFAKYMEMYTKAIKKEQGSEDDKDKEVIITDRHDRWEIGFAVSDGSFNQVSFVNSIATTSGGTHVNYIAEQICEKLLAVVKKKNKGGFKLKPAQIKNHIFLFVNCSIVNPAFTSQTKEQLTTKHSQFGSKPVLSDKFLKAIEKTEVIQNIMHFAQQKADQLLKKTDGNKRSRMNHAKLTDANKAGTKEGHECVLILTEGDSAAGLALAGRAVVGADYFGVFPLRGKMLNVRDASIDQISKNQEIQNIKKFIGLQHKKEYTDTKGLRYGHIMIMTDQDHDGSHIKGLLINFLQCQFPSLLKIPDFLMEFITPIVKVWKGDPKKPKGMKSFFSMPEYEEWKEQHKDERGWDHKYYKGLGTSQYEDAQIYFNDLAVHKKHFHTMRTEEERMIELVFSKKQADARKEWLRQFTPGNHLDLTTRHITYDDFVNKELILFSMADNMRSIPSVIDGFKPGQRKILYTCFRRNLKKDVKVVDLAGSVMGTTDYAYGESSMQGTIVGLAQNFVGSNNINCLEPSGNFGSRLQGGADAASARYIYTRLSPFARKIFHPHDDDILTYGESDGNKIEPDIYVPILPMVLVNGADGIGTGWSSSIPNYNPLDIVENLRIRLQSGSSKEDMKPMLPWFRGFEGTVDDIGNDRYKFTGTIRQTGENEVEITELPVRMWSQWFKEKLEDLLKAEKTPSIIKDYTDYNTPDKVHFIIKMEDKHMAGALQKGLEETFKIYNTMATSNLVAFDPQGRIHKYATVLDIMEEFYHVRLQYYEKRKQYQLNEMHKELDRLTNQSNFIQMIIDGKLVVSKKKKAALVAELKKHNFTAFPKVAEAKKAGEQEDALEDEDDADRAAGLTDYDYLLGMAIWSLTQERVDKLLKQIGDKEAEIDRLIKLTPKDIWVTDLDAFVAEWALQLQEQEARTKMLKGLSRRGSRKLGGGPVKGAGKRKKKADDSDDSDFDFGPAPKKGKPKAGGLLSYLNEPKKPSATAALKNGAVSGLKQTGINGYLKKDIKNETPVDLDEASDIEMPDVAPAAPAAAPKRGRAPAKTAKKPTPAPVDSDSDEDVFAAVAKEAEKKKKKQAETVTNSRTARGAAKKATNYALDGDSDSDSEEFDMSHMVQTLSGPAPGSAAGGSSKTTARAPASKLSPIDLDEDLDETNYDSPAKPAPRNDIDTMLSSDEDDDLGFDDKKAPAKSTAKAAPKAKAAAVKPAPKSKAAAPSLVAKKATQLSPAAKAYAARLDKTKGLASRPATKPASKKNTISMDSEDEELENTDVLANDILSDEEDEEPAPKPKAKPAAPAARPGRNVISSDEDEEDEEPVTKPKAKPAASAARPGRSNVISSDEDEEDEEPVTKSKAKSSAPAARPGRRAAAKPAKYIVSDDDESEEASEPSYDEDSE